MIKLTKTQLYKRSKQADFISDALSKARINGDTYEFNEEDFTALMLKHNKPIKSDSISSKESMVSKTRFKICQSCERSPDKGFRCDLYKNCCFSLWRCNPANDCPEGKWPKIEEIKT
jgi:hypothetical protein